MSSIVHLFVTEVTLCTEMLAKVPTGVSTMKARKQKIYILGGIYYNR